MGFDLIDKVIAAATVPSDLVWKVGLRLTGYISMPLCSGSLVAGIDDEYNIRRRPCAYRKASDRTSTINLNRESGLGMARFHEPHLYLLRD